MGELVRVRIRVSGIVQGVGFRFFARTRAMALGLSGSVRNVHDGTVEVVAEGEKAVVNALIHELRIGPRYASVEGLDIQWEDPTKDFEGFDYAF
jgi:acylphosphatase